MKAEERREQLRKVQEGRPYATGHQLVYRGSTQRFDVYEIPLDCLVYNPYNGRVGSVVKSYEKQSHTLDPEDPADARVIEDFLWESKESANKATLENLRANGQINFGIVTSDGMIIDGNRRASLMNRIRRDKRYSQEEKDRCSYFKAVILPDSATKRDILQLETSFQMGEDAKVDYNPIEKYLKCKDLEDAGFTRDEIASFMGIQKKEVDQDLEILDLIDQYLAFFEYDGIYTMAEGHEDSFQKLNIAYKQYKAGVANMWDYTDEDLTEMLGVAFDYIRLDQPQNDVRDIFRKPSKSASSIFGSKERWRKFLERHNEEVGSYEERPVEDYLKEATGEDITLSLRARDKDWQKHVGPKLDTSIKEAQDEIASQLSSNTPVLLISKANSALASVDENSTGFSENAGRIREGLDRLIAAAERLKALL